MGYNIVGWLEKNKDPLNGSVVTLMKKSTLKVLQTIWEGYVSSEDAGGKKGIHNFKYNKKFVLIFMFFLVGKRLINFFF